MVGAPAETRPSPDALLKAAEKEKRGKLKIFLGAAPGVGKTYEMLAAARRRKIDGVDVVVGLVETHGRAETEAQAAGLEVVPRRLVDYKGRALEEMDLDAILRRRPALVLVDELAHTNAEGSRHPKRYLDVEELLGAGIDVYSTMNVQHIESLNDVVARITRIRVRETVPDRDRRRRRRGRAGRSHAGRPDGAAARGQGLCPRARPARAAPLFLARQPHGIARAGAAAHRRARRRPDAELHARARHHRPVGGRRARGRLPRSQPRRGQRRARRQAHRRRARCRADRALCRDRAPRHPVGSRARPPRRDHAPCRPARRRGGDGAGPLGGRGDPGLRALAQRHARGGRQVAALALVRAAPRFGGRSARAQQLRPRRRGGAVGRGAGAARPDRLAAQYPEDARALPRGCADDGGRDGPWQGDRRQPPGAQRFARLRGAGAGGRGATRAGALALGFRR